MLRVIEKAAENGDLKKQLHAITGKEKCQMVYRYLDPVSDWDAYSADQERAWEEENNECHCERCGKAIGRLKHYMIFGDPTCVDCVMGLSDDERQDIAEEYQGGYDVKDVDLNDPDDVDWLVDEYLTDNVVTGDEEI